MTAAPARADEAQRAAQARARRPRPPRPQAVAGGRRRWRPLLLGLAAAAVIAAPIAIGAYIATQSVYFIGVSGDGFVSLYRGLPYTLPADVSLFSRVYESGVSASALSPRLQRTVTDHKLRSHGDATDLVRQLELGKLAGQQ